MTEPIQFGPFELTETLGRGGMAEVLQGVHSLQGIPVAIKVMTSLEARGQEYRDALRHEVRAIAALDHPNIIAVYDYGEVDEALHAQCGGRFDIGSPYIAMELARHGTVRRMPRPRTYDQVRRLLLTVLDALAHAHARGIVHLDLKPGNILLADYVQSTITYKLADFGIAHIHGQPVPSGTEEERQGKRSSGDTVLLQGTPPYMAPEQFRNDFRDFGPATDLYALGCIGYFLTTGKPPFVGRGTRFFRKAHLNLQPPPLKTELSVPEGFEAWLHRLLAKHPAERFQRAADAAWALRQLGDAEEEQELDDSALVSALDEGEHASGSSGRSGDSGPGFDARSGPDGDDEEGASSPNLAAVDLDLEEHSGEISLLDIGHEEEDSDSISQVVRYNELDDERDGTNMPSGFRILTRLPNPVATGAKKVVPVREVPFHPEWVPPMPDHWSRETPKLRGQVLVGAGLSLYGLRAIPMAGRMRERDVLWRCLAEVRKADRPGYVLLSGPMGTGKSRLAEWLCERAHEAGAASVLRAIHAPESGLVSLQRMLETHFNTAGLDRNELTERLRVLLATRGVRDAYEWNAIAEWISPTPEVDIESTTHAMIPNDGDVVTFSTPSERYILLARHLARLGNERPIILYFDDVQWGSDALGFAEWLQTYESPEPIPVLILMTSQDEALAERQTEGLLLSEVMRSSAASRVQLDLLPYADQLVLVRDLLGLEAPLATRVAEKTEGNPLFAVQLVRDWVQREALIPGPQGFRLKPGVPLELPNDLRQVWAERIRRVLEPLPAEARTALELAATLGVNVYMQEWLSACELERVVPPPELLDTLLAARMARVNTTAPGGSDILSWSFTHGMIRATVELEAQRLGRWRSHTEACRAMLRKLYPADHPGMQERLGRYALAGGDYEDAISPLYLAAQAYRRSGDIRQAHRMLNDRELAIERAGLQLSDPRAPRGWLLRSELCRFQGRVTEASTLADQVDKYLERFPHAELAAESQRCRGRLALESGDPFRAIELLQRALALYEELGNQPRQVSTLLLLANSEQDFGRAQPANVYARKALGLAQGLKDLRLEGDCLIQLGHVQLMLRQEKLALTCFDGALQRYMACNHQLGVAQSLRCLGSVYARTEQEQPRAHDYLKRALTIFEKLGFQFGEAKCRNDIGELARLRGELAIAEQSYRKALDICQKIRSGDGLVVMSNLSLILLQRHRYDEARRLLEPLAHEARKRTRPAAQFSVLSGLLPATAGVTDWVAYDRVLTELDGLYRRYQTLDPDDAWCIEMGGQLAIASGETHRGLIALTMARTLYQQLGNTVRLETLDGILERFGWKNRGGGGTPSSTPSNRTDR